MKYVCKVCGYVYDDEQQAGPFADLPDSWVCPMNSICNTGKKELE